MGRSKSTKPSSHLTGIQITETERQEMLAAQARHGFSSLNEYIRHLHRSAQNATETDRGKPTSHIVQPTYPASLVKTFHKTSLGTIYKGDSLGYLHSVARPQSVDLVMTSPPFGLVRKKSYGNENADEYCEWFRPFADGFRRVLKDSGSLVIDIGGAWIQGRPTRSLYHFKLLIMLVEEFGFHLAQEHFWWNPAKLPTPAEWTNIRRVRVKDAVNTVWWLSPTPWPKANNRRVLAPYSASMRQLMKSGYTAKTRPSGHVISTKFGPDRGGSVPPNLLAIANTESAGIYQDYCRREGIDIHPARFPSALPEYFIRFLTDPGDLVIDPFGGSCVSGAVAEALGRRWVCSELNEDYLRGALARFHTGQTPATARSAAYTIHSPCSVRNDDVPLIADGGRSRPESTKLTEKKR